MPLGSIHSSLQALPRQPFCFFAFLFLGDGLDLGGTRRVGGLLGVAGRLSGTVSPFRAEQGTSLETPSRVEVAGPLGTPLGLAQRKRASPRGEAGTSGFLSVSDSDRRVPAELGPLRKGLFI